MSDGGFNTIIFMQLEFLDGHFYLARYNNTNSDARALCPCILLVYLGIFTISHRLQLILK